MAITEKYVTVAGGGLHDGTSEANAWTFDEAIAGVSAGDRVNVKAGTHPCSTSTTTGGTNTDQIHIRGYVSTIGDLDETPLGTMVGGTEMPLVEVTGSQRGFKGIYTTFSHLAIKGMSDYSQAWETGQGAVIRSCRFTNSSGSSLYYNVLRAGPFSALHDCYLEPLSGSSGTYGISVSYSNCVINAVNCVGPVLNANNVVGCTIIGSGSGNSVGIRVDDSGPCNYIGNTIVNCTTGIIANTYNYGVSIVGCYFSNCGTAVENIKLGTFLISSCCYHNVTTQLSGWDTQYLATVDATDQFVDSAGGDYTLLPASNGYNSMQPNLLAGTGTVTKKDIGAIRHADPGSTPYTPTAGTRIYPFRQWVEDDFGTAGGGGATHYDPFTNPRF